MASELIKAILETEETCAVKENEAKKKAEAKKQQAKSDAAKIIADAHKQVEKMLEDDKAAISASAEQRLAKERKKTDVECGRLSEKAAKNLDRVTAMAAEALVKR